MTIIETPTALIQNFFFTSENPPLKLLSYYLITQALNYHYIETHLSIPILLTL